MWRSGTVKSLVLLHHQVLPAGSTPTTWLWRRMRPMGAHFLRSSVTPRTTRLWCPTSEVDQLCCTIPTTNYFLPIWFKWCAKNDKNNTYFWKLCCSFTQVYPYREKLDWNHLKHLFQFTFSILDLSYYILRKSEWLGDTIIDSSEFFPSWTLPDSWDPFIKQWSWYTYISV